MKALVSESLGGPRKETVASMTKKVESLRSQVAKYKSLLDAAKAKLAILKAKEKATAPAKKAVAKKPAAKKTAVKRAAR